MTTKTVAVATAGALGAYGLYSYRNSPSPQPGGIGANVPTAQPAYGGFGIKSLRLASTELLNHDTKRLRFALPDENSTSGLKLTSSMLTIAFPGGRWFPVLRPYTPVSKLDEPGYLEFMVKKYPEGKQSTHLHSMQPGDSIYVAGPLPGFTWTPNKHSRVVLIAGGAGITPMYQLIQGILADPKETTRIDLVWGVNSDDDIFLAKELSSLEAQYPDRFKVQYTVSHPKPESPYPKGYITRELLEKTGLANDPQATRKIFVCGPPAMETALTGKKGILQELGYSSGDIHRF